MAVVVTPEVLAEGLDKAGAKEQKEHESRQYKRFLWDSILRYVAALGVTLVVVGLGEEFFLERGLACNTPDYVNRDQYTFVVVWCSRMVRHVDLLPLLILIQSLCIFGAQEVWEIFVSSSLEQFFSLSPRLKRLRDKKTGCYDVDTARIVRHLCEKYQKKHVLYRSYWAKIMIQMIVCFTFCIVMFEVYERGKKFERDFICHEVGSLYKEHVNFNFTSSSERFKPFDADCTYTTAEAFLPVWIINLVLLFAGIGASTSAVIWLLFPHWTELDPVGKSDYYYYMGMNNGDYSPQRSHKMKKRIRDDLDFLVMLLFNLDRGQGESFYDVQVELKLQEKWSDDFEEYSTFLEKVYHMEFQGSLNDHAEEIIMNAMELPNALGVCLFDILTRRVVESKRPFEKALHLFCGSKGSSIVVARVTRQLYAVDFNKYCHLASFPNSEDLEPEDIPAADAAANKGSQTIPTPAAVNGTVPTDNSSGTGIRPISQTDDGSSRQQTAIPSFQQQQDGRLPGSSERAADNEPEGEDDPEPRTGGKHFGNLPCMPEDITAADATANKGSLRRLDNSEVSEHKDHGSISVVQEDQSGMEIDLGSEHIADSTERADDYRPADRTSMQKLELDCSSEEGQLNGSTTSFVQSVSETESKTVLEPSFDGKTVKETDGNVLMKAQDLDSTEGSRSDKESDMNHETSLDTDSHRPCGQLIQAIPTPAAVNGTVPTDNSSGTGIRPISQTDDGSSRQQTAIPSFQQQQDGRLPGSPERAANNESGDEDDPEPRTGGKHFKVEIIEEVFGNLHFFRVPFDIMSKTGRERKQLMTKLNERSLEAIQAKHSEHGRYDLIVVSCLEPHFRVRTATVILDAVFMKSTKEKCLIVLCSLEEETVNELMEYLNPFTEDESPVSEEATDGGECVRCVIEQPKKTDVVSSKTFICSGQKVTVFFGSVWFIKDKHRGKTQRVRPSS
jgi:hypothetical protein